MIIHEVRRSTGTARYRNRCLSCKEQFQKGQRYHRWSMRHQAEPQSYQLQSNWSYNCDECFVKIAKNWYNNLKDELEMGWENRS